MLATGGSAVAAVGALKDAGARRIRFLSIVAAPRRRAAGCWTPTPTCTSSPPRSTASSTQQGYILPGLGDAGDRLFGTRHALSLHLPSRIDT